MNFDGGLLFGCNSISEVNHPFSGLGEEHTDLLPTATPHNGSLLEKDKMDVKNLLDDWNMGFLFQTCLGEYKCIALIVPITFVYSVSDR